MKIAIFGGTFDPVHRGHLAVARAAQRRYKVDRIYFVPADVPPHKRRQPITGFHHRYAMLALALAGKPDFVPSLIEAPGAEVHRPPSYTVDTMRRFRRLLPATERLYFLIGIDSFVEISSWHDTEALLREFEFIVASRPGFSLGDVAEALPKALQPASGSEPLHGPKSEVKLGAAGIHLLPNVEVNISATEVRAAAARGRSLGRLVGAPVADYIRKTRLYRATARLADANGDPAKIVSFRARRTH